MSVIYFTIALLCFISMIIWVCVFDTVKSNVLLVTWFILSFVVFIIMVFCLVKDYKKSHYTENNPIIVIVSDKTTKTKYVGVPGKGGHSETDYYIWFDDNKIEVGRRAYNEINIGEKFILEKQTTYKKVPDGSDEIVSVIYKLY